MAVLLFSFMLVGFIAGWLMKEPLIWLTDWVHGRVETPEEFKKKERKDEGSPFLSFFFYSFYPGVVVWVAVFGLVFVAIAGA